jgi:predicted PurR-regulated permease PerM
MDQRDWRQTRDVLICVICAGIIFWALWLVLGQFVEAIVILLLSMTVAFLLTPIVNLLVRYGIPRVLASVVTYVVVLGLIGWLAYELGLSLIQQALIFSNTVTTFASSLPQTFHSTIQYLEKHSSIPPENINAAISQFQAQATDFARSLATNAVNAFFVITNALLNIVLVIVLSFYLTLDGKRIRESFVSIVPQRWLTNVLLFEDALNRVVGNYIRGQLTLALVVGVCTSGICLATGLGSYALICGVLAFLFETIPMVGPALASIMPLLLSLLLPDAFPRTFIIALCFMILQAIESNILGPRIVGHAVGLHPVAAIMALLVGAKLFGVFGALVATPLVATAWVIVASIYHSARGETADEILAHKRAPWTFHRPSGIAPIKQYDMNTRTQKTFNEERLSEADGQLDLDREQSKHIHQR